ncbi:lipase 1-like [Zophobas morio]|uniref:lipase 1-like n=1 Tax=Zophobas morio TaxID=2755281 RepID=UPI0030838128
MQPVLILFISLFLYSSASPIVPADDEDGHLTVPEIITKYGYPAEVHNVVTSDGYILTLHRIPHGKNMDTVSTKPVLVQHGLLSSSADWVITGVEHGLGFILADEGYDVWLGNGRGNYNSRNHTTLDPNTDAEFWHFSWHEIGAIDIPAMIDHILETTGQPNLYYVGHSQGTTVFYVMATTRPEYNDKIKAHFSLAPIAYMKHMTSPLMQILAYFVGPIDALFEMIGWNEFLPNNELITLAGETLCKDEEVTQALCSNVLFVMCGYSPSELNETILPVLMGHLPAGASTRQVVHYGQEIVSGYFRQYDFGDDNMDVYGSSEPPSYDLSLITAPSYLFYSHNDWMAAEVDVVRLCEEMGDSCNKFLVSEDSFNHLDYLIGMRAPELVYAKVISLMARH